MKNLLLIALPLIIAGCKDAVYVDANGNQVLKPEEVNSFWKSDIDTACLDGIEYWVYSPHSQTSVMAVRMESPTRAKTCN